MQPYVSTVFFSYPSSKINDDISGKGNSDSGQIELKSTCHLALNECEKDGSCSRYLDQVKKMCDPITCDRNKCMRAIREFYANIPERHSLDIAFCLCK